MDYICSGINVLYGVFVITNVGIIIYGKNTSL
jgi:hypothetical protein